MVGARGPTSRRAEDTVGGCEALAASDLARAAAADTANGRLKFQHSGESWLQRADLLGRLQASLEKRTASERKTASPAL